MEHLLRYDSRVAHIEVRLLGGLEVRAHGDSVAGFESRRAKALLAFVVLARRGAPLERERLSALLWPDEAEDVARQNLRQALYNLRRTLGSSVEDGTPVIVADRHTVGVHEKAPVWVDVEAFESAVQQGLRDGTCTDATSLAEAVRLYRGDLLSGFALEEAPGFDEWLLVRQEGLRDLMLGALRALVSYHEERGEYFAALEFARRHVEIDQLSEAAHRDVMRLHSLLGDRGRAIAQYEQCRLLLQLELGVEPLSETRALHDAILTAEIEESGGTLHAEPAGPVLPLVGRRDAYASLKAIWKRVLAGRCRLTLVVGPEGIGKSRLVKSFIHDAAASANAAVLLTNAVRASLPSCYQPIEDLLRSAIACDRAVEAALRRDVGSEELLPLGVLLPELAEDHVAPAQRATGPDALAQAVAGALGRINELAQGGGGGGTIVFVDDLQWADPATLAMLAELMERLGNLPLWFVAAYRPQELPADSPLQASLTHWRAADRLDFIALEPLTERDVTQLVRSVVGDQARADVLAALLVERSGGLPLAVAEWINLLRDEGQLKPQEQAGRWTLAPRFESWARSAPRTLDEVITRRIRGLPTSTRRLLALGAVIGETFGAPLLQETADEAQLVLEHGLETLLERWLARHAPQCWFESRRERDLVLWNQGARRGTFAFAHKIIRQAVLHTISSERRQVMHRQIAAVLEARAKEGRTVRAENLARHLLLAHEWERAAHALLASAERAIALGEPAIAQALLDRAEESLSRCERSEDDGAVSAQGSSLRARIQAGLEEADRTIADAHARGES